MWFVMMMFWLNDGVADQLWDAARAGDLVKVKALITAGTDVNVKTKYGATALTYACDKGHLDLVRYLVESGAEINIKDTFYEAAPISWALFNEHDDVVVYLVEAGSEDVAQVFSFGLQRNNVVLAKAAIDSKRLDLSLVGAAKAKLNEESPAELVALLEAVELPAVEDQHQVSPERLAVLSGTFHQLDLGMTVELKVENGLLAGVILPDRTFTLMAKSDSTFDVIEQPGQSIEFKQNAEGAMVFDFKVGDNAYSFNRGPFPNEEPAEQAVIEPEPQPVRSNPRPWPMFRGTNADGNADGQAVPTRWDVEKGENIAWRTAVAGLANASPVVWGDKVFVLTAISGSGDHSFKPGLYGDVDSVEDVSKHSFRVIAVNLFDGKVIWDKEVVNAAPAVKRHLKATHANSTPATDGQHLVVLFGSVGLLSSYDFDGNKEWSVDLGPLDAGWFYDKTYQWGHASSPVIYRDTVVVQADIQGQSFIAAYHLKDGSLAWKTNRDEIPTWGTPTVVRGAIDEIVTNGPRIRSYKADSGELLWEMSPNSEVTVATPIYANNLVYVTGGYPPARPVYAFRPGGKGDLSQADNQTHLAWSKSKGGTYMPTPIAYGKYLFTVANDGRVTTYDAVSGEQLGRYRLGAGVSLCSSPIAADGRLFFAADSGEVIVVTASENMRELARNDMGEILMATPAASDGVLLVRGLQNLYAIRQGENGLKAPSKDP